MAYLVLAGISTPLVLSVHSTVSFDFATSLIPGWHTTIFPPYFVAGAIFGGFAMVLTLIQETTSQKATSLSLAIYKWRRGGFPSTNSHPAISGSAQRIGDTGWNSTAGEGR
jgi:ABC-type transport system involved in multi-copper enzyme maturation permease subunit